MNTIKCFIIDDESHAIDLLKDYIANTPDLTLLGTFNNPMEGLAAVRKDKPDILFLDIDMPMLNGLELSTLLDPQIKIIFVTGHANHAVEAFEKNALDFLLKPISYPRFLTCIKKVMGSMEEKDSSKPGEHEQGFFYIKSDFGKIVKIDHESIVYIEASNNFITIYLNDTDYKAYITLKDIELHLPESSFSRIHKSFIVNTNKIKFINGNQIFLTNKKVLQLGATYRDLFFKKLDLNILKKR